MPRHDQRKIQRDRVEDRGSFGLGAWNGRPKPMSVAHSHVDIEWNLILSGSLRYFIAGQFTTLAAGRLGIFWGGIPHRLLECDSDSRVAWVTVPLAWFMQWNMNETFVSRLLRGEMFSTPAETPQDERLLSRWESDLDRRDRGKDSAIDADEARQIVMLEVEARLRRYARAVVAPSPRVRPREATDNAVRPVEQMAKFMGQRYREEISVTDIAGAVKLHPNYAMQLFRARCGMSIWEYLIRLRLSHAQRLLLTTDEKVTRISLESGFGSTGRFYAAFSRVLGQTPRAYRLTQRGE